MGEIKKEVKEMNLGEHLSQSQKEEELLFDKQMAKMGDYTNDRCPNCDRLRIMMGEDKKRRCQKCCWCIEDKDYDYEFMGWGR